MLLGEYKTPREYYQAKRPEILDLINRALDAIDARPTYFDMEMWFGEVRNLMYETREKFFDANVPACGTVHCFSGEILIQMGVPDTEQVHASGWWFPLRPNPDYHPLLNQLIEMRQRSPRRLSQPVDISDVAPYVLTPTPEDAEAVGIDYDYVDNSHPLFYIGRWPYQFREAYDKAALEDRPRILRERVNHWLDTGQ